MNAHSISNGDLRMRKFAINKAASTPAEGKRSADASDGKNSGLRGYWRLLLLFVVITAAFLLRFVFAYGISAGDNYALSGGTSATTNLRVITEILAGTFDPSYTAALNYPFGAVSVHGPFFDYLMAGFAAVGTMFGMSDATAAAGALAWSAPVFGALTCIPVYLIGKKVSGENETVGILSALFYATFAIIVMTTPFSNGTSVPLLCLLVACFTYALVRVFEALDQAEEVCILSFAKDRNVLKHTVASTILFALIALTWVDARVIILAAAVCIFIGFTARRARGRNISGVAGVLGLVFIVGALVAAAYYVPCDLWDAVASGLVVLGLITGVLTIVAGLLENKSWVLTAPSFLIVIGVIAAIMYFTVPDTLDAILHGNSIYAGTLMESLAGTFTRTDVSSMAAYYGWLTVWLPLAFGCWMLWRYRRDGGSRVYGFTMLWLFAGFFLGWFSSNFAVAVGAVFAVGSALAIYNVAVAVDLRRYFKSLKGNGIRGGIKKAGKFFPLITVIAIVALVAVPNTVYAVDAATPTNDERADYFGGLGYTISTSDVSLMDTMWNHYGDSSHGDGAIVTWYGYSNNAVSDGAFNCVTDAVGGGTSAMSSVYLSDSTGSAVASMAVRLMLSADDVSVFTGTIQSVGLDYDELAGLLTDVDKAKAYIKANPDSFKGINVSVADESATYLAAVDYMTSIVSDVKMCEMYNSVCETVGKEISYVEVDGGMIPMYYRDSSNFSTIAYFGDRALGNYGEPSEYYTVNPYTGTYNYTAEMYDTFLWRALIGVDADESGASSSISLLNSLALSDGSVKAVPGYGLSGFKVSYWHVMYNADDEAKGTSDGWENMDAYEAIQLQNEQGGVINYLSSVVVLEYVGIDPAEEESFSGKVVYQDTDSSTAPASGVKVAVFEKSDYDPSGKTGYVLRSIDFTDSEGKYDISIPVDEEYYIVYSTGTTNVRGGTTVFTNYDEVPNAEISIGDTKVSGALAVGDDDRLMDVDGYVTIESDKVMQADLNGGAFEFEHILPGTYSLTAYTENGTVFGNATLSVPAGVSDGVLVSLETGKIKVTAEDMFNQSISECSFVAFNSAASISVTGQIVDGVGTIDVPAGKYTVSLADGYVSLSSESASVTKDKTRTVNMTGYPSEGISVPGVDYASIMAIGFTSSVIDEVAHVPTVTGCPSTYTVYAVSGNSVTHGILGGELSIEAGYTISGKITSGDVAAKEATVTFISENGETFVFGTDSDGVYNAILPDGEYVIYSNNAKDKAFIGTLGVNGSDETCDIALEDGRKITSELEYQTRTSKTSTRGVGFVDVTATFQYGGKDIVITLLTNSNGYGKFYLPDDVDEPMDFKIEASDLNGDVFNVTEDFTATAKKGISNTHLSTWVINGIKDEEKEETLKHFVNPVNVKSEYGEIELKAYSDKDLKYTVDATGTDVVPGQYSAKLENDDYFFDGTIYVYPGDSNLHIDVKEVLKITVITDSKDVVSVKSYENSDGEKGFSHKGVSENPDTEHVYYLDIGFDYIVTVRGDNKVAYYTVTAESGEPRTVDMTSKAESTNISGFVGVSADGKVVATYTDSNGQVVNITTDVKDGEYSVTVPMGFDIMLESKVEVTSEGYVYVLTGSKSIEASKIVADGVTCNFASLTDDSGSEFADNVNVSAESDSFKNGRGVATVFITNNGNQATSYVIEGGEAFVLDKAYTVSVDAGSTVDVPVSGYYNVDTVGYGNDGMTIVVKTLTGTKVGTCEIPADAFAVMSGESKVVVDIASAEGAVADSVNGYAYMYAVTVDNPYGNALSVKLAFPENDGDWIAYATDSTGYMVCDLSDASFILPGYGKEAVYVMLINTVGSDSSVPSIALEVTVTDINGNPVNVESNSLAASSNTANGEATASDADVSQTDASVDGESSSNSKKEVSMTFWTLAVLTMILLLLMVWGGMKRGVFSRR